MTQHPDPAQPNPDLVTSPAAEPEPKSDPHVAVTGERLVLNTQREEGARPLAEQAEALVAIAASVSGLDREGVTDQVRQALTGPLGREPEDVEIERITEALMRASRSSLSVEDDDGVVLATYDAPGYETREQPNVSDPADEDRPFYS